MMISIVLNLLNEKRHIRDLLDSLVTQEQPFEIVIVDAGSWDGTTPIIRKYMRHTRRSSCITGRAHAARAPTSGS
ncbi:MAG: glycosyltransferase [Thermoplasmata archaeon]|nr:glycosyltransferase [Thermoplasmata archaeon]